MPTRVEVTLKDGTVKVARMRDGLSSQEAKDILVSELGAENIAQIKKLGEVGPVPTSATPVNKPSNEGIDSVAEIGAIADKTVRGGLLAVPRLMQTVSNFAGDRIDSKKNPTLVNAALTKMFGDQQSKGTKQLAEDVGGIARNPVGTIESLTGGPIRQPQTKAGQALGNIGESAVASLVGPGGLTQPVRNMIIGASAGAGGELGSKIDEENPLWRTAGALAGGGLAAVGSSFVPNSTQLIKQSTKYVKDADWKNAKDLERILEGSGISHLKSQLLGPSSTMDDLIAQAASHPEIRPLLINAVKNAPEEVRGAFTNWMHRTLPTPVNDSRRQLLNDIQKLADDTENSIHANSNAAYTEALAGGVSYETYPADTILRIRRDLRLLTRNPETYGGAAGAKEVRKWMREYLPRPRKKADGTLTSLPKGYLNNKYKDLGKLRRESDDYKNLPVDDIKKIIQRYTDEDFGAARAAKKEVIDNSLVPFQKGLAGQIARMGGGVKPDKHTATEQAINITFPKNSPQAPEIKLLGKQMGADTVGSLLREHMTRSMEDALSLQRTQSAYLTTPFSFTKSIFGNNAQRRNIDAALEVIAKDAGMDHRVVQHGFRRMMKAFDTFKDLRIPSSIDRGELAEQAGENLLGRVATPNVSFRRMRQGIVTKKTYEKIAEIVTSPGGLEIIEKIAKSPDPKAAQVLARSIIAAAMDEEQEEAEE